MEPALTKAKTMKKIGCKKTKRNNSVYKDVIYRTVPLYKWHTPDAERLHRDSLLIIYSQEDKSLILDVQSDKIW